MPKLANTHHANTITIPVVDKHSQSDKHDTADKQTYIVISPWLCVTDANDYEPL